jgi:hypothetical protein
MKTTMPKRSIDEYIISPLNLLLTAAAAVFGAAAWLLAASSIQTVVTLLAIFLGIEFFSLIIAFSIYRKNLDDVKEDLDEKIQYANDESKSQKDEYDKLIKKSLPPLANCILITGRVSGKIAIISEDLIKITDDLKEICNKYEDINIPKPLSGEIAKLIRDCKSLADETRQCYKQTAPICAEIDQYRRMSEELIKKG